MDVRTVNYPVVPTELHTSQIGETIMTKKMITVISCASLLLIQPQILLAQDGITQDIPAALERNVAISKEVSSQDAIAQDNWEAVRSIPAGDEITVVTRDGKQLKGRMSGISGPTLSFTSKNRPVSLDQPEIKKIYRQVTGGSRAKNSLLGTGIGAGIGAGIGLFFVAAYGEDVDGDFFATLMGFGAGIGAGVGVLFKGSKKLLIYEVK